MTEEIEEPPFWHTLKRRRLKAGNCLEHCNVLIDLSLKAKETGVALPYVVAMGTRFSDIRDWHCWLETDSAAASSQVVVDLITGRRVHDKSEYYKLFGIDADKVRRFDAKTVARKITESNELVFWEQQP
jgi:hypothetical protein